MTEFLEAKGQGRLLMYDPSHMTAYVIADKLRYPSGIELQSKNGKDHAVLFSETSRGRVRRCILGKDEEKCRKVETFAEKGLPCMPAELQWAPSDDLSPPTQKNGLLVGCAVRRSPTVDSIIGSSLKKRMLGAIKGSWVEAFLYSPPALARLNSKGRVTDVIEVEGVECLFNVKALAQPDYMSSFGDGQEEEEVDRTPVAVPGNANVLIGCPHLWQTTPLIGRFGPIQA